MAATHDWGLIHRAVVNDIKFKNGGFGIDTEVTVDWAKKGYGRMDVYDTETRTVWEVKSSGTGSAAAMRQAQSYVGAEPRKYSGKVNGLGMIGRFSGNITRYYTYNSVEYAFDISYETPQMGVILYSFNLRKKYKQPASSVAYATIKAQVRTANARTAVAVARTVAVGVGGGIALGAFGWGGINERQLR